MNGSVSWNTNVWVYCKDWSAPYCDLLDHCQVFSLSSCRRTAKLYHLYKDIYRLVDCENAPVAHRALQYSSWRSDPTPIQTLFAQSLQYQFSFYPHSISLWNINNEYISVVVYLRQRTNYKSSLVSIYNVMGLLLIVQKQMNILYADRWMKLLIWLCIKKNNSYQWLEPNTGHTWGLVHIKPS